MDNQNRDLANKDENAAKKQKVIMLGKKMKSRVNRILEQLEKL